MDTLSHDITLHRGKVLTSSISPHLLISVFITPRGLGGEKYFTKFVDDKDDHYYRISRFITSLITKSHLNFSSSTFYIELDPCWRNEVNKLCEIIYGLFPNAEINNGRLKNIYDWQHAAAKYSDDDIILLETNDDHSYMAQTDIDLYKMVDLMNRYPGFRLGSVTHQSESFSVAARNYFQRQNDCFVAKVTTAIGNTLVRGDFFREWWENDELVDQTIVRPDNPFGKSVSFPPTKIIIPQREIFRHMDGYGHIGIHYPLAPLRNLVKYGEIEKHDYLLLNKAKYKGSYWPSDLIGIKGHGSDYHFVRGAKSFIERIKTGISILQMNFAVRIHFSTINTILGSGMFKSLDRKLVTLIFIFTNIGIKNIPDVIIFRFLHLIFLLKPDLKTSYLHSQFGYLGFFRAIAFKLSYLQKGLIKKIKIVCDLFTK